MDYKNIYYKIIEKAKNEDKNGNRGIGYFEKHHILPKSLGGSNDKENLVQLTAREHFICHWLLVKMFNKGTKERNKMLYAFWRMKSSPDNNGKRYINSKAYEKLRIEYVDVVSKLMSENQKGENNSQFGKHWYTNRNTGECKYFSEPPDETWIEGRNLFQGESSILFSKRKIENMNKAKSLWNEFHSGDYSSIRDFCRKKGNVTQPNVMDLFKKYIPISRTIIIGSSHNNKSNKELVDKFY